MNDDVLTTHVLDVASGRPAAGVETELRRDGRLVTARKDHVPRPAAPWSCSTDRGS
ncbi:MAG TPA: hypothetical protein VFG42_05635 [Baekduia sp.]|uniref:hypothetical protein n=1 Tax=Baekduia sp. TaxID=2600305 RepID=UPI002D77988F|nr:hypothetical protein [Baekduia sp.]HET6506249.1 hypothetical protein [Baekduia sp.]